jgi:hypothetical protein
MSGALYDGRFNRELGSALQQAKNHLLTSGVPNPPRKPERYYTKKPGLARRVVTYRCQPAGSLICQFPSSRQTIFRTSAALAGTATRQSLALKRQASGLSWVIAAPDRVALWHGDCALAGIESGYRGSRELYRGLLTMLVPMIHFPGKIAVLLSISLPGSQPVGRLCPTTH